MKNIENEDKEEKEVNIKINSVKGHSIKVILVETFLKIFIAVSLILGVTLYLYYRGNTTQEEKISMLKDIHHLKANIKGMGNFNLIKGYVEITEIHEGLNILGRVEGLKTGSTHGIHVLEFSDISEMEKSKVTDDVLKHYNPMNKHHSCPSVNVEDDDNFHFGDFGNIIANQDGMAFFSIIRKIPLISLNGRIIVISAVEDKCDPEQEKDSINNIVGYGLLNAYKPKINTSVDKSNDYFLREINTANKKEFENKNKIIRPNVRNNLNHKIEHVVSKKSNNKDEKKTLDKIHKLKLHEHKADTSEHENERKIKNEEKVEKIKKEESSVHKNQDHKIFDGLNSQINNARRFTPTHEHNNSQSDKRRFSFNLPVKNNIHKEEEVKHTNNFGSRVLNNPRNNFFAKTNMNNIQDDDQFVSTRNTKEVSSMKSNPSEYRLFNNMLEDRPKDYDKIFPDPLVEMNKPVLVNKNMEPQFLDMKNQNKLKQKSSEILKPSTYSIYSSILPKLENNKMVHNQNRDSKFNDIFNKLFPDTNKFETINKSKQSNPEPKIETATENALPNMFIPPIINVKDSLPFNEQPVVSNPLRNTNTQTEKNEISIFQTLDDIFTPDNVENISVKNNYPNLREESPKNNNHQLIINKPRSDYSFMQPNIEPIVHGLMKNSTSSKLVRQLDQDLINPYKDNINSLSIDNSRFDPDAFMIDFDKKLVIPDEKPENKTSFSDIPDVNIYKQDQMNVFNKIDHINELIKNKAINQLKDFEDNNSSNNHADIDQSKIKPKQEKNSYTLSKKVKKNTNRLNEFRLLKFRENDQTTNNKIYEIHNELSTNPLLRNVLISSPNNNSISNLGIMNNESKIKSDDIPAESTHKMMENLSKGENKIKHFNLNDKDKLFIKDVKNNINKLDKISSNIKHI